jgi:hypothetical protein
MMFPIVAQLIFMWSIDQAQPYTSSFLHNILSPVSHRC